MNTGEAGPGEAAFGRVAALASRLLGAEVALVTRAAPEQDRLVPLGAAGPGAAALAAEGALRLAGSLCGHVVAEGRPLVLPDVSAGTPALELLCASPPPGIAAYLGLPLRDPSGRVIGTCCAMARTPRAWTGAELEAMASLAAMAADQLALAAALARSEETERRFRDLAANVPGAIFRYMLRPDGTDAIEYMSPGCLDIWEIDAATLQGDPAVLWAAVEAEDLPAMQASVAASAREMARWRHRWRITTPSGRRKWLEGHGSPSPLPGGGILWNTLILDVTTEVAAQETLDRNMRLLYEAQKQESIGRIAGGVAHDVNNLLGVILAHAELVLEGKTREGVEAALAGIVRAAESGGELTRQLLSFARRSPIAPEPIDLNRTVRDMATLVRRTLPQTIRLETSLMAGLWPVRADRGLLDSALLNLVLNARDAMPEGGRLTIETANARIDTDYLATRGEDIPPGRYAMLAVTDTGAGIDPALLPDIFEPFVTTKGPERGTGLGLAMVQGFVRQAGGLVRVYSEPGRGSAFKLYLPVAEGAPAEPRPAPGEDAPGPLPHLLLVEDEPELRQLLAEQLRAAGYAVSEAGEAEQALALFRAAPDAFSLVVTDVIMPGAMTGPRLVAALRAERPALAAIYVSAYPHEANVHGNGLRPEDISLTKPFSRATLIEAVRRALRRPRPAAP